MDLSLHPPLDEIMDDELSLTVASIPLNAGEEAIESVAMKQEQSLSSSTSQNLKSCSSTSGHQLNDSSNSPLSLSTSFNMMESHFPMALDQAGTLMNNPYGNYPFNPVSMGEFHAQAGSLIAHTPTKNPEMSPFEAGFYNSSHSYLPFNSHPATDHFYEEEAIPNDHTSTFFTEIPQPFHDFGSETVDDAGRKPGPRTRRSPAKSAREYWERYYADLPEASRRGPAWKEAQLLLLDSRTSKKRKQPDSAKETARKRKGNGRGHVDPALLVGLLGRNVSDDDENPISVSLPAVSAFTKKDFFK
jgi:hypothetical protein